MHLSTLVAFVLLEFALCLIPGPAVLSVVGAALGRGARAGFATAFGILTGNLIYFIVSALGLASILVASHTAFTIVKWCGAAYLAYLGVRALLARPVDFSSELSAAEGVGRRGWLNGTVVQLSNPKALVFFTAILPQFVDPKADVAVQLAILGAASLAVELVVLSFYIACADGIRKRGINARSQVWAERIGGAFLLAVAAVVAREAV
ncbi:MAG TPA: LysE family translocator [Candidatus Acidoferrales bacterium]|nr:LysE family translocator [Candidatus Acidoferrales bacterium]